MAVRIEKALTGIRSPHKVCLLESFVSMTDQHDRSRAQLVAV